MTTKTYAQLTAASDFQASYLLASWDPAGPGPLKSFTGAVFNTYLNSLYLQLSGSSAMTGTLLLYAGAQGTPGLAFGSDNDTGFYSVGANSIGLSAGGVQVARWETTGETITGALAVSGAISSPTITTINASISAVASTTTSNTTVIGNVSTSLANVSTSLTNVSSSVVAVTGVSTSVSQISSSLSNTNTSLSAVSSSLSSNISTTTNVSSSLTNVSSSLSSTNSNVTKVSTSLANVSSSASQLSSSLSQSNTSLSQISSSLSNTNTSLSTTNSNVTNVSTSLANVSTSLGNVSTSLGNVSTSLANVSTSLAAGTWTVSNHGTNYTAVLADANSTMVGMSTLSAFTIPANASVAYTTGTELEFINSTVSPITVAITSDTLQWKSSLGTRTVAVGGVLRARKTAATVWFVVCDIGVT